MAPRDMGWMDKPMTAAQRAYEEKRAKKAGLSLDVWLKQKTQAEANAAKEAAREKAAAERAKTPPGKLKRMMDRLHKPLKPPAK